MTTAAETRILEAIGRASVPVVAKMDEFSFWGIAAVRPLTRSGTRFSDSLDLDCTDDELAEQIRQAYRRFTLFSKLGV